MGTNENVIYDSVAVGATTQPYGIYELPSRLMGKKSVRQSINNNLFMHLDFRTNWRVASM